jgi:hypothetical protein
MASFWVGARLGAIFPFGSAYTVAYDPSGYYAYGRDWSGLASGGPAFEVDAGARVSRRYIIYGFWEHGILGTGGDSTWREATQAYLPVTSSFGDQSSASTDCPGLGFRWSSTPDSVGLVLDLGIGYRLFHESWASGATMTLQGFGDFRVGFGADIRVNRLFSLSPLLMFSTGEFHDRNYTAPRQPERPIPSYTGPHGTATLSVGGHFDFAPSY